MSIEAMKQALEAWQTSVYGSERHHKAMLLAMTNMGQAIEQAEKQEPVAWVGLTDDEIEEICWTEVDRRLRSFAKAIEAKLKEKNT